MNRIFNVLKSLRIILFCVVAGGAGFVGLRAYFHHAGRVITSRVAGQSVVVHRVLSGDTFVVEQGGVERTIHLLGVNAPDPGHPHFGRSTDALSALILGQRVMLFIDGPYGRDALGRPLGRVEVDGFDVAQELLEARHVVVLNVPERADGG